MGGITGGVRWDRSLSRTCKLLATSSSLTTRDPVAGFGTNVLDELGWVWPPVILSKSDGRPSKDSSRSMSVSLPCTSSTSSWVGWAGTNPAPRILVSKVGG